MSNSIREARIEKLKQVQEKRKEQALKKVEFTLAKMQKEGMKINFSTVAEEANVSTSYLYKYPEIKQRIAEIRNQQSSMPVSHKPEPTSKDSHLKIVARLKQRIQELEEEIKRYRKINESLAGKVYRVSELEDVVNRQNQRIQELEGRLKEAFLNENSSKVLDIKSKIKSSEISHHIRSQLDILGIKISTTLKKSILSKSEEKVLVAIEALKQALETTHVSNPSGWLKQAIDEEWEKNESTSQVELILPSFVEDSEVTDEYQEEFVPLEQLKLLSNIFTHD